ncbi:MAG: FAD-dependent oxidoreductase [bacterium]
MPFQHLFSPVRIGSMSVKNRIAMPSMGLMYTRDGSMNDRFKHFYYERARGGAGLIITGPYAVDKAGGGAVLLGLDEDRFVPQLKKFNQEIHRISDARIACQLFHSGRYGFSFLTGEQCVSASPIPSKLTGETPRELTIPEIQDLVARFGAAAARAREAGFDAVEVLACTGYLLSQFLSPITNVRTDAYGGGLENRMRFPLEIVASVRRNVGGDFPILVRVAGHDYMPGSHTNRESSLVCKALEQAGVDAINVTGGWHETRFPQLTYAVPPGAFVYLAQGIKEAVGIPVLASNRLGSPELADKVLREGRADMICMGRPLIADPHLPNKAREGRTDEILPCMGCNEVCFDNVFSGQPVGCMLNPLAGHEAETVIERTERPKKIVVAGGGPAGLMAAATAARRGHRVVLMEADPEFGGQILLGARTPDKADFAKIVSSLLAQARSAGVILKAGCRATAETVRLEQPDEVFVATGARPAAAPFPGADQPKVKLAWDVLKGKAEVSGKRVVVIGGSATGCETALKIAQEGTLDPATLHFLFVHEAEDVDTLRQRATLGNKEVAVVDLLPRLANNVARTTRWVLLNDLRTYHVKMMADTKVTAITDEGVEVERKGARELIPADAVVLATGAVPCRELHDALRAAGLPARLIGDAKEPRRIVEAIQEGFEAALAV